MTVIFDILTHILQKSFIVAQKMTNIWTVTYLKLILVVKTILLFFTDD